MGVSSGISTASSLPATITAEKSFSHSIATANPVSTTMTSLPTLGEKVRKKPGRKPNPNALEIRKDKNRQAQRDYRRRREFKIHNLERENELLKESIRAKDSQIRRLEMQLLMVQGEGRPLVCDPPSVGNEQPANTPHYTISPVGVEGTPYYLPHPSLPFGESTNIGVTSMNPVRAPHWVSSAADVDPSHVASYSGQSRSPPYHQFSPHHISPGVWPALPHSMPLNQPRQHPTEDMAWNWSFSTQSDRHYRPAMLNVPSSQGLPHNLDMVASSSPTPAVATNTMALPYHLEHSR